MLTIRKILSWVLIVLGLCLILDAFVVKTYHYPWRTLFGSYDQSEFSVQDPASIVAKDVVLTQTEPEGLPAIPSAASLPASLPGDEKAISPSQPAYVQLGILKIPVLNVSEYVLEGTEGQLHYGVGQVVGSKGIGQKGNCVIAGHRATTFRYLNKLVSGNRIILKAEGNVYTYSVYESFTVLPEDTWVLGEVRGETYALTLITCTPYLVNSQRLIVRARLIDINGMKPEGY
ncbi:class D sortase [Desulfosporosinus hippei]|uniref:LPXTG-site transpeptidase (Sortase) family protein n=1 Tax=Desulfosporosinus hippei DSM 8344 TaxID=1121419 RepID=A0A1G8E2J8_9FIRM|nr:class D sortase [Desulfosporosinus hippei]SDH63879.1 LPXTG-site transpeptidase (sortase) family protein [Desulfosporosinus hippei DSM 8344]